MSIRDKDKSQPYERAICLNEMAHLLIAQGAFFTALPLLEAARDIAADVKGKASSDYATALNNVAGVYRALGRQEEAESILAEATRIRQEVLGKSNRATIRTEGNLMGLKIERGEVSIPQALLAETSSRLAESVKGVPMRQGPRSNVNSAVQGALALLHSREGDAQGALAMLEASLRGSMEVMIPNPNPSPNPNPNPNLNPNPSP